MKRSTIKLLVFLNVLAMVVLVFLFQHSETAMMIFAIVCLIINVVLNYLLRPLA